ncbi:lysis system i-spanin subunit Rz [Stenotrophomonas rhizophila]|uniref:lysis system i-spanin subunit Rz n=1 Tax=Stenotrophomonas rhizophila TaxID=216778 RepID=UPI000EB353A6|nr:lysis system i-spanin subunit Rz [Stenotrophomonas rhizophila]
MNRTLIAVIAFVAWSAGMFGAGWAWRGDRAEGVEARQQAGASAGQVHQVTQARATEHTQAEVMASIGAKHEEDRAAAETVPAAVVAELRSGTVRLRHDLATCHTGRLSEAAAGAIERDAPADLGVTLAGPAIGIGRDADDQLRACQAVIAADRVELAH